MARIEKVAKDTYGTELKVGDAIVFSWGGSLRKAYIESIKLGIRASLVVYPLNYEGNPFTKNGERVTAKVKDSMSTVKI